MFFGEQLFSLRNKNPLSLLWLAGSNLTTKKLSKAQVLNCDISKFGSHVESNAELTHRLRITGTLLLGLVVIYQRKIDYLIGEMKSVMNRVNANQIKHALNRTPEIDLPSKELSASKTLLKRPQDGDLENILNETFYNEHFFNNEEFMTKLQNLLHDGYEKEFGLDIDCSFSQDSSPLENPTFPKNDEVEGIELVNNLNNYTSQMMNDEEINFDVLANNHPMDDDDGLGGGGDGGDLFDDHEIQSPFKTPLRQQESVDMRESMEDMNRRISQKRTGRKRKRGPIIDESTTLSNDFIRASIADTSDIQRKRKKHQSHVMKNNNNGDDGVLRFPLESEKIKFNSEEDLKKKIQSLYDVPMFPYCKEIRTFYDSIIQNPPRKRRKIGQNEDGHDIALLGEFGTPEISRSHQLNNDSSAAVFGFDDDDDGLGGGGGGDGGGDLFDDDDGAIPNLMNGDKNIHLKTMENNNNVGVDEFNFSDEEGEDERFKVHLPATLTPNNNAFDKFLRLDQRKILSSGMKHPTELSDLTFKYLVFLKRKFEEKEEMKKDSLNWNHLMKTNDRRVVGVAFYHTLILAKYGYLQVSQDVPYDNIFLKKGRDF